MSLVAITALAASGCGEQRREPQAAGHRNASQHRQHADRQSPGSRHPRPARREAPAAAIPADAKRTTVTEVTDGDTVHLAGLGSSRLIGVDTPEVYGQAECYGRQASAFTGRELAPGRTAYYVHGAEPLDRYGRDLVYVWLPGGTFYNALLVRQGYAVILTIAPNDRFADLFRRLSATARAADRGLWSPATCGGNPDEPVGSSAAGGGGGGPSLAGDRDCADFSTQAEAQRYFEAKGGPRSDPDRLDADHDGAACEDLP